ncbi:MULTISPECIES: alpha/beta hydrolase-fold protein [Nostocales]|uniref:Alpha/beta hydrolase n=3 Tax=Nostocales TaxID=1161 RepID=A0A0C1N2V5_9CYAN|nr:alpha/beta hydrolase-fold protein [Tolypothrix bouteillei]KAF3889884.1 alpha/beta hydrolase [Tolypothrix bouteillei VB521301]
MTATLSTSVIPSAEQIAKTQEAINTYIRSIDTNPNHRSGAYPYYRFHDPGKPIRGTVLLFHGLSASPHQMWRLADYLFSNGFNFYQPSIAGHVLLPPDKYWPQIDLKPEIANPLRQKVQQDWVMQNFLSNLATADTSNFKRPNLFITAALVARIFKIEPRLLDIIKALQKQDDPDFDKYFISSHMNYLIEARARLAELDTMPGPIYTLGLSVGGAVALALAADRPDRVKKVVAYAPLLKIYSEERRQYVLLTGPLDIRETGWDPNLQFPVGVFTACDRFGGFVRNAKNLASLQNVPTFLVLTENEDAADVQTNKDFFNKIGGERKGHCLYTYPTTDLVPHPMVDPTEVSQNMSNRFWQSLYQETFRFLTTGKVNASNMSSIGQESDVPVVAPVS